MTIVIRTDASSVIGSGHVMRCMTLAHALRERGIHVTFVCREHAGNLCDLIARHGFAVCRLPIVPHTFGGGVRAHAVWLGEKWQDDAARTISMLTKFGQTPDWLVVDHYGIDIAWEQALRPHVGRMMVIDDLADRLHDCEILLDQNLVDGWQRRYEGKVPDGCEKLLGPTYALLQPEYAELRAQTFVRKGLIRRILVFFGGADPLNLTGMALDALLQLSRPDIGIDVVLPGSTPYKDAILMQAAGHMNVALYDMLPSLAPLMQQSDLAIGGGGATTWERLCLGLPALVVTLAENQHAVALELAKRRLIHWIGDANSVTTLALVQEIGVAIAEMEDGTWSQRCMDVLDGMGVDRVCAALLASDRVAHHFSRGFGDVTQ